MIDADTPQHCLQCWCMIIFAQTARCFVSVGYTVTQTQTNTNSRSIFSATWVQTFQPAKVTECFQQSQTTLFLITQLRPHTIDGPGFQFPYSQSPLPGLMFMYFETVFEMDVRFASTLKSHSHKQSQSFLDLIKPGNKRQITRSHWDNVKLMT